MHLNKRDKAKLISMLLAYSIGVFFLVTLFMMSMVLSVFFSSSTFAGAVVTLAFCVVVFVTYLWLEEPRSKKKNVSVVRETISKPDEELSNTDGKTDSTEQGQSTD